MATISCLLPPAGDASPHCLCRSLAALLLSHRRGLHVSPRDAYARLFLQTEPSSCPQAASPEFARRLHSLLLCTGLDSDPALADCLVRRFTSFGCLFEATMAFCKVPRPSAYTTQDMLSSYIRDGRSERALCLYKRMEEEGSPVNRFVLTGALKACGASGSILSGREIHGKLIRSGCECDPFVVSALIDVYTRSLRVDEARNVFNLYISASSSIRDKVVWCTMISGYVRSGLARLAIELFYKMLSEGYDPDAYAFSSISKACSDAGSGEEGKCIHANIIKMGLSFDSAASNALINMYASHGKLEDARDVFDRMINRTIASWGAMIAGYAHHGCGLPALELFSCMDHRSIDPNRPILLYTLKACSSIDGIIEGMMIHDHVVKNGLESDVHIGIGLVEVYSKCGNFSDSHKVHGNLPEKTHVSWCVLIQGYVNRGHGHSALSLLRNLQHEGILLDKVLFLCFLKACRIICDVWYIKLVHIHIISAMLDSDETIANALIDAYSKCSDMGEAHKMFEVAPVKSVVSWSSMVSGYADCGENLTAIGLYNAMCRLDKKPDRVIYLSVMKACAKLRSSSYAKEIHDHIVRVGIEDDTTIGNSIINMYAKCGVLDEASKVFSRLPCKDVLSWGAIMDGHACHGGLHGHIQQCLHGIDEQGLKPNDVIFLNLLSVCGHVGAVTTAVKLFHSMDVGHGIIPNIKHITSMVDLLSRAGSLAEAKCMLLGNLNFTGWTSLLSACRVYGAQP